MGRAVRILGIDPGLLRTGWGVIEAEGNQLRYVACGVVKAPAEGEGIAQRLRVLHDGVVEVIQRYAPAEAGVEETFVNKNPLSSLKLGHARGAALLALSLNDVPVYEYAATLVKKTVVGAGRAEKQQVMHMVNMLLPGANSAQADAADALAVAICHASHRNMRSFA